MPDNVIQHPSIDDIESAVRRADLALSNRGNGDGGNLPPMDLPERVGRLESTVGEIRTDVAVIKSSYATRENVSDAKNALVYWMVATSIAVVMLVVALIKL